jgi:hypothetical protein
MTYEESIAMAINEAGDEYTVLGCTNIGDASSPVLIYDDECPDGAGTQYQSASIDAAIEWAGEGMSGVLVVTGVYDDEGWSVDTQKYLRS